MTRTKWMLALTWPLLTAGGLLAAETAMTPEQITSAVKEDSVTIPMAGEFFAAISKQGRPQWKTMVRVGTPETTASRAQIALVLGTLVADGYIAVEAQDSLGVKNIGKEIINLAKKLNVSQSVLGRGSGLNDFAENNDWNALREELEATQNEVKLSMDEQNDQSLVTLVTLGAWLRGTEIVSTIVETGYTPESARLLRQPAIIEYLLDQISALPKGMQKEALVMELQAALTQALTYVKEETPSEKNIKELHRVMAEAVTAIAKGPKES